MVLDLSNTHKVNIRMLKDIKRFIENLLEVITRSAISLTYNHISNVIPDEK